MRQQLHANKRANSATQHDIKLELDVRSQHLIEQSLRRKFPRIALLGEEGIVGDTDAQDPLGRRSYRWNGEFWYTIPHACVSIALQRRPSTAGPSAYEDGYETLVGVVYDPFSGELWTATQGGPARLNGKIVKVSQRRKLNEAIVSIGFAKSKESLEATLPYFVKLVHRVRKVRIMGSAALALTYVATGRFDAYIERGIRIWDIAAGGLIVECAGGEFWRKAVDANQTYRMVCSNGLLRKTLAVPGWR